MTSISKKVYIDKLDDMVNKYNNIYHSTIKVKPIDVKDNTYNDFGKENSDKDPKFQVSDHVRISKNIIMWTSSRDIFYTLFGRFSKISCKYRSWFLCFPLHVYLHIYSRVPNNRLPPPRLLIFRFYSTQDIFILTSHPPHLLLSFKHFCSHF